MTDSELVEKLIIQVDPSDVQRLNEALQQHRTVVGSVEQAYGGLTQSGQKLGQTLQQTAQQAGASKTAGLDPSAIQQVGQAIEAVDKVVEKHAQTVKQAAGEAATALKAEAAAARTAADESRGATESLGQGIVSGVGVAKQALGELSKELNVTAAGTGRLGQGISAIGGMAGPAGIAIAGLATTVVGLTVALANSASEMQKTRQITQSLLDVNAVGDQMGAVTSAFKSMRTELTLLGVSGVEFQQSFRKAFIETGDVTASLDVLKTALKTASVTGGDFASQAEAITRAANGQVRGLREMGIFLDAVTQEYLKQLPEAERIAAVLDIVNTRYKDQATGLDSLQAKQALAGQRLNEFKAQLSGEALKAVGLFYDGVIGVGKGIDTLAAAARNAKTDVQTLLAGLGLLTPATAPLSFLWAGTQAIGGAVGRMFDGTNAAAARRYAAEYEAQFSGELPSDDYESDAAVRAAAAARANTPAAAGEQQRPRSLSSTDQASAEYGARKTATRQAIADEIAQIKASKDAEIEIAKQYYRSLQDEEDARYRQEERNLQKRVQAQQDAFTALKQGEADRYKDLGRQREADEAAELTSIETRKAARKAAAADEVEDAKKRGADVVAEIKRQEKEDLDARDNAIKEREKAHTAEMRAFDDEIKAREKADAAEKRSIDDNLKAAVDARARQRDATLAAIKAETEALDAEHRQMLGQLDAEAKARQTDHDAEIARIDERTKAREAELRAAIQAIDDEAHARQFAQQQADANQRIADAQKKLTEAQAGGNPQQILAAQQALAEAQRRQVEQSLTEIERLQKAALQTELDATKQTAEQEKATANASLSAFKADQQTRRDEIEETYNARKAALQKETQETQQAAAEDIRAWREAAATRKQQIDDNLAEYRESKANERQALQDQFADELEKLRTARKEAQEKWREGLTEAQTATSKEIEAINGRRDADIAALDAETAGVKAKYRTQRQEDSDTHEQIMRGIAAQETEFNRAIEAERQSLSDAHTTMRREIDATWGNGPNGVITKLEAAKQKALEGAGAISTEFSALESAGKLTNDELDKIVAKLGDVKRAVDQVNASSLHIPASSGAAASGGAGAGATPVGFTTAANSPGFRVNTGPTVSREYVVQEGMRRGLNQKTAEALYDLGERYGVDPNFALAVWQFEQGFRVPANNQLFSIGQYEGGYAMGQRPNGDRFPPYVSAQANIEDFYRHISQFYYPQGQTDTYSILWGVGGGPTSTIEDFRAGRASHAYGPAYENRPTLEKEYRDAMAANAAASRALFPVPSAGADQNYLFMPSRFIPGWGDDDDLEPPPIGAGPSPAILAQVQQASAVGGGAVPVFVTNWPAGGLGYGAGGSLVAGTGRAGSLSPSALAAQAQAAIGMGAGDRWWEDDGSTVHGVKRPGQGVWPTTGERTRAGGKWSADDLESAEAGPAPGAAPVPGRRDAASFGFSDAQSANGLVQSLVAKYNEVVEQMAQSQLRRDEELGRKRLEILQQQAQIEERLRTGYYQKNSEQQAVDQAKLGQLRLEEQNLIAKGNQERSKEQQALDLTVRSLEQLQQSTQKTVRTMEEQIADMNSRNWASAIGQTDPNRPAESLSSAPKFNPGSFNPQAGGAALVGYYRGNRAATLALAQQMGFYRPGDYAGGSGPSEAEFEHLVQLVVGALSSGLWSPNGGWRAAISGESNPLLPEPAFQARLAVGGLVRRPLRALVGEDGPEAVVPLEQLVPMLAAALQEALVTAPSTLNALAASATGGAWVPSLTPLRPGAWLSNLVGSVPGGLNLWGGAAPMTPTAPVAPVVVTVGPPPVYVGVTVPVANQLTVDQNGFSTTTTVATPTASSPTGSTVAVAAAPGGQIAGPSGGGAPTFSAGLPAAGPQAQTLLGGVGNWPVTVAPVYGTSADLH